MPAKSEPITITHPALADEWDWEKNGTEGYDIASTPRKTKAWWNCPFGHSYAARIDHRTNSGSNCPICSGAQTLSGYNDLETINPALAAEWHPTKNGELLPSMVAPKETRNIWWQCNKGHEWEAKLGNRSSLNRGCPICTNQKVLTGFNDMATTHPSLAAEWDCVKNGAVGPETIFAGTGKMYWWKCATGKHSYQASGDSRSKSSKATGCSVCSGKQIARGSNDLTTTAPSIAAEWHPTLNGDKKPEQVTIYSNQKAWWLCENGHSWEAVIGSRQNSGCARCSKNFSKIEEEFYHEFAKYISYPHHSPRLEIKWCHTNTTSVDIFGEYNGRKLVIEYDGEAWHKSKLRTSRDLVKNQVLLDNGYTVVRIRENKLEHLKLEHPNFFQTSYIFKSKTVPHKVQEILSFL
jgi:hypothetical protein